MNKLAKCGVKNTEYRIEYSQVFLDETEDIYNYISVVLCNEGAAKKLVDKIYRKINKLKDFPRMFVRLGKIGETTERYRRIVVENYVILYTIDDDAHIVKISHIYYGKQKYINIS